MDTGDDDLPEVEIHIDPIPERLEAHGITEDEFAEALSEALDEYHDLLDDDDNDEDDDSIPAVDQLVLKIKGKDVPILDLAEVRIEGDMNLD